jgi:hypothetical protein
MMLKVHIVVPDLLLPEAYAAEATSGLLLPALERLLAHAQCEKLPDSTLEAWLCNAFGVADEAIAPITLRADGMAPGQDYWLRADPVHMRIDRDRMIPYFIQWLGPDEAEMLCASLNAHFADIGLHFVAPHPLRWYLQLEHMPRITTMNLAELAGRDASQHLPQGADGLRWHGILNEVQMLLYDHPVNQERELRGDMTVNSIWLWGGGKGTDVLSLSFNKIFTDSALAEAFASVAGISCSGLPSGPEPISFGGADVLVVWEGMRRALGQGDLAGWQESVQKFDQNCIAPLLAAMRKGHVGKITLDALQENKSLHFMLDRKGMRKFWRRRKPLQYYSAKA